MLLNSRFTENLAKKSLIIFMSILLILGTSLAAKPQAANATTGGATTTTLFIANESYYGDIVNLDATVNVNGQSITDLRGTVTFYDGDIQLGSPQGLDHTRAGITFGIFGDYLSIGVHNFKAVYSGYSNYQESSSANVVHTVKKRPTKITLTSSLNPANYGEPVTFTAVVAKEEIGITSVNTSGDAPTLPDPTGKVTFTTEGHAPVDVTLANGQATLTADWLYPVYTDVTAVFTPDVESPYQGSEKTLDQIVRNPTEITLNSSKNPSTVGEVVYFTATIAKVPVIGIQSLDFHASSIPGISGTVTFYDGSVVLETVSIFRADSINNSSIPDQSGTAKIYTSALTAGSHNITASYTVGANMQDYYMSSHSETLTQVVNSVLPTGPNNPPASPAPNLPKPTRQVKVDYGNGEDAGNQVDITRSSKNDGTKVDSVNFDKDKATEIVTKAAASGKGVARIVIDDLPNDKADEVMVNIPKDSLGALTNKEMQLEIKTNDVKVTLSKDSLDKLNTDAKDLFFRFIPINKPEARTEAEDRVTKEIKLMVVSQNQTIDLVSKPMTIETNYSSRKTTLEFPLADIKIPENTEDRAAFLSELAVFIEHSDGEKVVNKGKIIYDSLGKPVGIEIEIEKFSTFTIIQAKDKASKAYAAYIKGFPDGTFQPNKAITRAELAAILVRMMPSNAAVSANNYTDIPADFWAAKSILQVTEAGYMTGDGHGKFNPNQSVTRAELAKISVLWAKLETTQSSGQLLDTEGHWASDFIAAIQSKGLMKAYDDGSFRPNQPIARAEAVQVLNQLFHRPTFVDANLGSWSDVSSQFWANPDIQAASHSFHTIVQSDGSETLVITK